MTDCIFCKIAAGEAPAQIVYEDEQILAFKDLAPKAPVHLLVIPKRHIENLAALTADDSVLMAHLMSKLAPIAASNGLEDGFRTITNTGKGGRQEVYHMHFHILGGGSLPAL
jgi:histidine triad (HIT) family protein